MRQQFSRKLFLALGSALLILIALALAFLFIPKQQETKKSVEAPKEKPSLTIPVRGDDDCARDTEQALALIAERAPLHAVIVQESIGLIDCAAEGSGMYAWENPPRYQVGLKTRAAGTLWYAGTIVHDACHSKQYHDYIRKNNTTTVPDDIFTGSVAEAQCLAAQYDALRAMGAPEETLRYIESVMNADYADIDYADRWW